MIEALIREELHSSGVAGVKTDRRTEMINTYEQWSMSSENI